MRLLAALRVPAAHVWREAESVVSVAFQPEANSCESDEK